MEQNFKIAVPEGCTAEIKQEKGFLVVTFEPEKWEPKEWLFGRSCNRPYFRNILLLKRYEGNPMWTM